MSSWPRRSTRDIRSAIQRFINCKLFNSVKMKIRLGFPLHLGALRLLPPLPSPHARALSSLNLVKKRDYSQSNLIRISLAPSFSPSWNQCCCLWPRCYLLITKYDQHFHFWDDEYMEFRMFEPRNEEISEEKTFAVKDATYWDAKRKPEKFRLASYSLQKVRVFWISIFPIIAPNTCQSKVSPYPEATPEVKALEKIKQLLHVNFFNKGKVLLHSCWVTREKNCTRNKILTKAVSRSQSNLLSIY